jgi:hypothetical protein
VPVPEHLEYLWDWYIDISAGLNLGSGFYTEVDSYSRLMQVPISPDDVARLRLLYATELRVSQLPPTKAAKTGAGVAEMLRNTNPGKK